MNESVAITKDADAKNSFASTRNSGEGIHRAQTEPERQLGSLRGVIGDIRRDGGTPSVDSIATHLSGMHSTQRAPVLSALQQTHGNQYVQRVVAGIQAKPEVGQSGDEYEPEVDRVVEQVSRAPEPQVQRQPVEEEEREEADEEEELVQTKPISDEITPPIQRQEATVEEEEEGEGGLVQTKPIAEQTTPLIQRQAEGEEEEEEELVQTRSETSTTSSGPIRYVQRAVAWIQAKLKVGQPGDKYEQEADRMADAVMRMPEPAVQRQVEGGDGEEKKEEEELVQTKSISDEITPPIQRQEATEEEEDGGEGELVQTKLIAGQTTPLIQRQAEGEEEDEEEVVQSRSETSLASSNHALMMDSVTHAINTRGSGGPMNRSTRYTLESYMGVDLSGVRVHTDSTSHQACTALRAHAFTHKNHIWLGRGQSQDDLRLMSHETTHVLQQGGIARRKPLETRKSPDLVQTLPIARAEQTAVPCESTPAHTAPTISPAAPVELRRSSTSPATETATPAPVEVTQAQSRAAERTAPEAAAAPGEATTAAVAGVAPEDQERLQGVMGRLDEAATQQEGPAASSASQQQASEQAASEASDAAPSPANEAAAMGQATQVETMNEQDAGEIDQRSFLEIVRQKLQELEMPSNPAEMDEFRERGGASGLQGDLSRTANQQAGEAQSAIRSATEAEPAPTNERVPEQLREQTAPGRVSNLQAQEVLPQPRTESEVSLEESRQSVEEQLTEENLTEERLSRANDPRFTAVQESREAVNEHADNAPQAFREEEQTLLSEQEGAIVAEEATAAREMEQAQEQSQREIDTEQQATMTEEERQRQEVSDHIESIYTSTQQTVEEKLNWLGEEVTREFTEGEERARARFEEFVADEMRAWKLRRYGERAWIPVIGLIVAAGTWVYDKFRGIDEFPEVEQIYENGKSRYIADLDVVIVGVANLVEETLAWCQSEIQSGRNEIQEYLEGLPVSLREVGEQTSRRVFERFDELRDNVEERRNSLADQLVESYRQAREALDLRIEEMQAENRGLVSQFMDGLRGVLEAIRNFRDRLMSIIGEAGDVIELILEDPIGFLENLLDALKGGFRQFSSNIWDHLRRGLMGWLFGTLATAGVTIPSEFSLRSVIGLILQILGITYDRIRTKVARIIGERNVAILERVWGYVSTLIREGPIGLWEQIKDDLGNLKDVVIEGIKQWVVTRIITAAVTRLVSMFNPAGAIIQAVLAIYNTVMFFIERINQIMELVQGIVRSLGAIVRGQLSAASNRVEQVMGLTIPIIISFLARLLGLGGIAGTISRIIGRVRRRVDRAIDRGLRRIVRRIRGMMRRGRGAVARVGARDETRHRQLVEQATSEMRRVNAPVRDYHTLRREKERQARQIERSYASRIGAGVRLRITFPPPDRDRADRDLDFEIVIGPNDARGTGLIPILDGMDGALAAYRGIHFLPDWPETRYKQEIDRKAGDIIGQPEFSAATRQVAVRLSGQDSPPVEELERAAETVQEQMQQLRHVQAEDPVAPELPQVGSAAMRSLRNRGINNPSREQVEAEMEPERVRLTRRRPITRMRVGREMRFSNMFYVAIDSYVENKQRFLEELQRLESGRYDGLQFTRIPFLSTSKRASSAARYALARQRPEGERRMMGIVGRLFVYLFSVDDQHRRGVLNIERLHNEGKINRNDWRISEDEVAFTGSIPGENRVGYHDARNSDSEEALGRRGEETARNRAGPMGGLRDWQNR